MGFFFFLPRPWSGGVSDAIVGAGAAVDDWDARLDSCAPNSLPGAGGSNGPPSPIEGDLSGAFALLMV
ncbi:hypothetical protein Q0O53_13715, partial [Staphylococcus aureus]|nr:hypothetical protein [Staphylococcus aureus]